MSDTPPPPPMPPVPGPTEAQIRQWDMWCHLSALAGLFLPVGNVLGPLLVWQIKKAEFPSVEIHGRAALNFQLTIVIAMVVGIGLAIALSFVCIGWLLIPVVLLVGVAGMVFAVIAGLKANEGQPYQYPYSLKLV